MKRKVLLIMAMILAVLMIGSWSLYRARAASLFAGITDEELASMEFPPFFIAMDILWKDTMLGDFYDDFIERAQIDPGARVMDFGAGAGTEAIRIAAGLQDGGQLLCVDIDPVVLKIAANRTRSFRNISFVSGDIRKGIVPETSIDWVIMHFVLHDIPDDLRQEVMTAVVATMRHGAILVIREPQALTGHGHGHGISGDEIKKILLNAGLQEVSSEFSDRFLVGELFEGRFRRP